MTPPNVNSSLDVFLNFDFAHADKSSKKLGVAKNGEGIYDLVSLSEDDKKAVKDCKPSFSFKKVVKLILKHQEIWLDETQEQKPQLELQLAWLSRKVVEYNRQNIKHPLGYKNPARWRLTVSIIFPNAFETKYKNLIRTKQLKTSFHIDRLATQNSIHVKCQKICKKTVPLKVFCMEQNCQKIHSIKITAWDLFKKLPYTNINMDTESEELFLPLDKPAQDQTIIIEGKEGEASILEKLINSLHAVTRASNISSNKLTYMNNPLGSPRIIPRDDMYAYAMINNTQQHPHHKHHHQTCHTPQPSSQQPSSSGQTGGSVSIQPSSNTPHRLIHQPSNTRQSSSSVTSHHPSYTSHHSSHSYSTPPSSSSTHHSSHSHNNSFNSVGSHHSISSQPSSFGGGMSFGGGGDGGHHHHH